MSRTLEQILEELTEHIGDEFVEIEKRLNEYREEVWIHASDLGKHLEIELRDLHRVAGPYVALAFAASAFRDLGRLLDPEVTFDARSVTPSKQDEIRFKEGR